MLDKYGNAVIEGATIQFDDDYFGHGMQRIVKATGDGILGFEAVPNVSEDLCFIEAWIKEIEVVTDKTIIRTVGKRIMLNGERYML